MGILPYLIAAASVWAIIATALALIRGKGLRRERSEHADAKHALARYRTAIVQLKTRATEAASEFEALQRRYLELQQTTEAQPSAEPPVPMILVNRLDISAEIGTLFEHVARVAKTIRHYSAYNRGHQAPEPSKARYDLLWLSDCLHSFDQIGQALAQGSVSALKTACRELLSMYEAYPRDGSGYNSRDTFRRLANEVPLTDVINAMKSIMEKASRPQQETDLLTDPLDTPEPGISEIKSNRETVVSARGTTG